MYSVKNWRKEFMSSKHNGKKRKEEKVIMLVAGLGQFALHACF